MVKLAKITITAHEGPVAVNINGDYTSIKALHNALKCIVDEDPGYNKVNYTAIFEDGETYEGRLFISEREDNPNMYTNLLIHSAGGFLVSMIQHRQKGWDEALSFLAKYSFTF